MWDDERLPARFWDKAIPVTETGCWIWTAATNDRGYGVLRVDRRNLYAHRIAYEALVGPIPAGLELDHVQARGCSSTSCVNPDHLEPVTHEKNCQRGRLTATGLASWRASQMVSVEKACAASARIRAFRTHCRNGHPREVGSRKCRPCQNAAQRRCGARRRDRA